MHIFTLIVYFNVQDDNDENIRLINLILAIMLIISFLQPITKC